MIFRSLCLIGAILAQKLNSFICKKRNMIFWHPWDPWERVHIDLNKKSVQTCCVTMYYAPLYAAICNYSKRLHLSHVNPFLKLKLFLQNISGLQLPSSGPCIRKRLKEVFFKNGKWQFRKFVNSFFRFLILFQFSPWLHSYIENVS